MSTVQITRGTSPIPSASLVNVDNKTVFGDGSNVPLSSLGGGAYLGTNVSAGALRRGSAVTPDTGSAGTSLDVIPLPADGSQFSGLVVGTTVPPGFHALPFGFTRGLVVGQTGLVQAGGILVCTEAEWDFVKGGSGGLAPGAFYYASQATPGNITATAPTSGQTSVPVGLALSTTEMLIAGPAPATVVA